VHAREEGTPLPADEMSSLTTRGAAREVEGLRVVARDFRLPRMLLLATWSCSIAPPLAGARCSPLQVARRILVQGGNMLARVIAAAKTPSPAWLRCSLIHMDDNR
ncbi:hypothetical protein Dimus_026190, partial [Dionaea muscipula]